jgi:MerR family transcriptional regulator, light-induced transcriptional regulator
VVSGDHNGAGFTIREISARSGVSEGALRMWETRYGFPNPDRLASGHRRYSDLELERVRAVVRAREEGLSLPRAIEHARTLAGRTRPSVFSTLRDTFPHLQPQLLPRRALISLSHAIEDECVARAQRPLLIGAFQREEFYREAEPRWRELSRTADAVFVLADFAKDRRPKHGPVEIAVTDGEPLLREWVLVCEADEFSACLAGAERLGPAFGDRSFEAVWTVEPAVVRVAARTCGELVARTAPQVVEPLRARLSAPAPPSTPEVRAVVELSTRILRYAAIGEDPAHGAGLRRR